MYLQTLDGFPSVSPVRAPVSAASIHQEKIASLYRFEFPSPEPRSYP